MFYKDQQRRKEYCSKKRKKIEQANENGLLLSLFGVVLEVNERGKNFEGFSGMNV